MTHRINLLSSVSDQDILNWRNMFNEVARICNRSEDVRLEVLTQIVDPNIQYHIGPCHESNEVIPKILKLKYNLNTSYKYQSKLAKVRQKNYYTLRRYLKCTKY
ncbi:hypothetical protein DMUE_5221 [Dictyocoela muelleri]|nr:hypothetical protein DMUE_5221 [Dictyocoela muelleri]